MYLNLVTGHYKGQLSKSQNSSTGGRICRDLAVDSVCHDQSIRAYVNLMGCDGSSAWDLIG